MKKSDYAPYGSYWEIFQINVPADNQPNLLKLAMDEGYPQIPQTKGGERKAIHWVMHRYLCRLASGLP
jgi:hypothetical protein